MTIANAGAVAGVPTVENQPPPRQILRDPVLDEQLAREGMVRIELAPPEVVRGLIAIYERHESGIDHGYYATMMSGDSSYKAAVDVEIRDLLWGHLASQFVDYEPHLGAFMIKHAGPDSEVAPHGDWMVVDETEHRSVACWFTATPLSDEVGWMRYLPGSHRYFEGFRGSPTFPNQWHDAADRVRDELMVPIHVEVGQALVYDSRLLHATPPNRSGKTRIAAYINTVPTGAPLLHYYRRPDGAVEGYWVDRQFFTDFAIGSRPEGEPFAVYPDYDMPSLPFEEIEARLQRATAASPA